MGGVCPCKNKQLQNHRDLDQLGTITKDGTSTQEQKVTKDFKMRTVQSTQSEGMGVPYKPKLDRFWEKKWESYVLRKGPEPGPHSDPNHPWNADKDKYKADMGIRI